MQPFESWKRRAPSDENEARAAALLRKVGDAETLSSQAQHRVAHRLRSPARRRPPLFIDVRLAAASVAVLLLLVTGALATVRFFDRQPEVVAAPGRDERASPNLADRTLALNDALPPAAPPEVAPPQAVRPEPAPSDALRLQEPEFRLESKSGRRKLFAADLDDADRSSGSGFAQPPSGWQPVTASRASGAVAMKKAASPSKAPAAELAAAGAPAAQAPPAAPRAEEQANASATDDKAVILDEESKLKCRDAIAQATTVLAGNPGDVERALLLRGSCNMRLGMKQAAVRDFRDYLTRFPGGRFARVIRGYLAKLDAR